MQGLFLHGVCVCMQVSQAPSGQLRRGMDKPENALESLDVALVHSLHEVRRQVAHDLGVGLRKVYKCLRVQQCPIRPSANHLHHAIQTAIA